MTVKENSLVEVAVAIMGISSAFLFFTVDSGDEEPRKEEKKKMKSREMIFYNHTIATWYL